MAEKNIELRSEKVRSIIGKIPPLLLRLGMIIITLVLIVIFGLMYYIPYRQTTKLDIVIIEGNNNYIARGSISTKDAKLIKIGQTADVLLFCLRGDHYLKGVVSNITESNGNASVEIEITNVNDKRYLSTLPSGNATINISDLSIMKRMLKKIL